MRRGDIAWIDLGRASGSAPAKRRPVLVVQAGSFLRSQLSTVTVVALTTNTSVAALPGNVFAPASATGLDRDSVVNVTQVVTVDRGDLGETAGSLPPYLLAEVDAGLRLALDL